MKGRFSGWLLGLGVAVAAAVAATAFHAGTARPPIPENRPIEVHDDGYASSETCRSCHPGQYDSWHDSYHRTMTQVATPETVMGDFNQATRSLFWGQPDGGVVEERFVFGRTGDEFWLEVNDINQPGAPRVRHPIVMTTGSHHMQVYWYASGEERLLEMVPFLYLFEEERWIPFGAAFLKPAAERVPRGAGFWNRFCIGCHTTNSQPRLSQEGTFDTHVAELGIACEACHGPGEEHLERNRSPLARYAGHYSEGDDPAIVNPMHLPPRERSQVCGQCHGIHFYDNEAEMIRHLAGPGGSFRPGDDLAESKVVVQTDEMDDHPTLRQVQEHQPLFLEQSFWSDGMVRVSGREYNMLVESPCYGKSDFSCFSCHVLHQPEDDPRPREEWANDQLKLGADGDQACLQCHEMPDVAAHTKHRPESEGSRCYNCHMPYTTYGLLKAIRSHEISKPTVQASLETGRPNACNQCHLDRSLGWAASHLEERHGVPAPEMSPEEEELGAAALWTLTGDAGQRALMAWSMGWEPAREASGDAWMPLYLGHLLEDPYPAVRYIAARSLRRHEGFESFDYDYLADEVQWAAGVQRARETWDRVSPRDGRRERGALLLDEQGSVLADRFRELAAQRDDRHVHLRE